MGVPDHLTCLLRNLYVGQEATVRTGHGTTDWFQIGKGVPPGCILSPCLFNLYSYILEWLRINWQYLALTKMRRNWHLYCSFPVTYKDKYNLNLWNPTSRYIYPRYRKINVCSHEFLYLIAFGNYIITKKLETIQLSLQWVYKQNVPHACSTIGHQ